MFSGGEKNLLLEPMWVSAVGPLYFSPNLLDFLPSHKGYGRASDRVHEPGRNLLSGLIPPIAFEDPSVGNPSRTGWDSGNGIISAARIRFHLDIGADRWHRNGQGRHVGCMDWARPCVVGLWVG